MLLIVSLLQWVHSTEALLLSGDFKACGPDYETLTVVITDDEIEISNPSPMYNRSAACMVGVIELL